MFKFAHPEFLYGLLVIPLLVGLFYYSLAKKSKRLKRLGDKKMLAMLMPNVSHWRPRVKFYILLVAIALSVFMMAGPQFGSKLEKIKRTGVELVLAVDVSNSMLAEDVSPSRMERTKHLLSRLIDELKDDKVALLVFAGESDVHMPMTVDGSSAKLYLNSIHPGMLAVQGTDIASALQLSMGLFSQSKETSKSIIVITDGENHDGDAIAMAKQVVEKGITVNVMGVGTAQGAPIPIAGTSNFRRDKDGNVVVTKLNEQMCQEVASAGNGIYMHVDNSVTAVNQLKEELDKLEKTEMEQMVYTEYNEQYDVIGWIVFVLLLLEVLLLERKNPLFKNFKLF